MSKVSNEFFGDLPEITDFQSLSKDQINLYEMCLAVKSASFSESLSSIEPGKMAHSRWLTTTKRLLPFHVSTSQQSQSLATLAEYIIKVYAPIWFEIKLKPQSNYGATHLWKAIYYSRFVPSVEREREVVDKCIQKNDYYGHLENV